MLLQVLRFLLAPFIYLWTVLASIFVTAQQETTAHPARLDNTTKQQNPAEDPQQNETQQSSQETNSTETTQTLETTAETTQRNGTMADTFTKVIDSDKSWQNKLKPSKPPQIEIPRGYSKKMLLERWQLIEKNDRFKEAAKERQKQNLNKLVYTNPREELLDNLTYERSDIYKDNVENFIGSVKVPLGIAGPLRVNGLHAQGDFYIPLATTEAALVASINRGISCINQSGGATCAVIMEGVSRDPCFLFKTLIELGQFLQWAKNNFQNFKKAAEKTTRHGKLHDIKYTCEGNNVHMKCIYTTADASGQNIVTIATEHLMEYIMENSPVKPHASFIEGGMSGDKKANPSVLANVRGRRVIAEVTIPRAVIETTLHATPEQLMQTANLGYRGIILLGMSGANLHFANAITAMAIATGQDPACASESHIGLSRCEMTADGNIYCSVTLPNIMCATVGGGTKLPSQRACLEIMGLYGAGKANALAEVTAAVCMAGELSLGAAVVSGDFAKAHKILARDTSVPINMAEDPLDEAFDKAQALLVKLNNLPSREAILDIYGLYKQATVGDINIVKPSFWSFDVKAKYKHNAWEKFKGTSKEAAMKKYIEIVLQLVQKDKEQDAKDAAAAAK